MTQLAKELNEKSKAQEDVLNEGIDFDYRTRTVSYNPSHEDNVDTSIINNPTLDKDLVPNINVWSIFKRKNGTRGDENPLIYALKGENWKFASNEDEKAIFDRIDIIADKFATLYPIGVTIIIPSGNSLNRKIAETIISKSEGALLIDGVICKMTTEEVDDIILNPNSKFSQYYTNPYEWNIAYRQLQRYFDDMDEHRDGYFSRHFIKDSKLRNLLDFTFKTSTDRYAEFANKINDQDVLIIDDTISRGQLVKEACKVIQESYAPKSITVLTLMSKLYDE